MHVSLKEFTLEDGIRCTIKSPVSADARNLMIYLKEVAKETSYMVRYIDEIGQSTREWARRLRSASEQDGTLIVCIFYGQKILAMAHICGISSYRKAMHRATLSLSVLREAWGRGLGRTLLKEVVSYAPGMGYSQIELEVACDNIKAISLYLSFGFQIYGRRKNAYYIEGEGFLDEYLMYKELSR